MGEQKAVCRKTRILVVSLAEETERDLSALVSGKDRREERHEAIKKMRAENKEGKRT